MVSQKAWYTGHSSPLQVPLTVLVNIVISVSPEYTLALPVWFAFEIMVGWCLEQQSSVGRQWDGALGDFPHPSPQGSHSVLI